MAAMAVLCACSDEVASPPDVSALIADFENPPAFLDDPSANTLAVELSPGAPRHLAATFFQQIESLAVAPATSAVEGDGMSDPGAFSFGASVRIRYRCSGWTPLVEDPGRVFLTGSVGSRAPVPVLWGRATNCQESLGDRNLYVSGDIVVDPRSRIFTLDGTLAGDGVAALEGPIRMRLANGVEYLHDAAAGRVVLFFDARGRGIRAQNAEWLCDDAQRCTRISP
jgi:hypothetical protein